MQQDRTPKTRLAANAAAEHAKSNEQGAAFRTADWRLTVDATTLKELSSLSQVSLKLIRVQRALAIAHIQVSLPQLRTYMKNADDAYPEFSVIHSR